MPSRSDLELKSRLFLGLGLLGVVAFLLLRILLPLLAIAGFGAGVFGLWQQHRKKKQRQQRQQARINAKFYQLLQQQQGRISVLDFAMHTQLDGAAAQAYLNMQAQVFSAFFETTPQGDLIYVFGLAVGRGDTHHRQAHPAQADTAWAYEQQTRSQTRSQARSQTRSQARSQAQQAHTAWENAKQIRTMRQRLQTTQPTAASEQSERSNLALKEQPYGLAEANSSVGSSGFISVELKTNAKNEVVQAYQRTNQSNARPDKSTGQKAGQKAVVKLPKESGYPEPKIALNPTDLDQSPVVRGRAYEATDRVVTIDVTAVKS